jgi:hypothetical protein
MSEPDPPPPLVEQVADPSPETRPLRAPWRRSLTWMALEVVLISASVFFGLAGQQWLEGRQHREQALDSLRRFRTEISANRKEVAAKFEYHAPLQKTVRTFVRADKAGREAIVLKFDSLQPPFFEQTAWELALATQSLTHLETDLAFVLSRIYQYQALVNQLGQGMMTTMYANPPSPESEVFLRAVDLYYGDLVAIEPGLLQMYDTALKAIEEELAD